MPRVSVSVCMFVWFLGMFLGYINHSGIIRLRSPTTRGAHARTYEAVRPNRAATASHACTPPKSGRHA
eukprot:6212420-Pleurochrysis_carterae.AAC.1